MREEDVFVDYLLDNLIGEKEVIWPMKTRFLIKNFYSEDEFPNEYSLKSIIDFIKIKQANHGLIKYLNKLEIYDFEVLKNGRFLSKKILKNANFHNEVISTAEVNMGNFIKILPIIFNKNYFLMKFDGNSFFLTKDNIEREFKIYFNKMTDMDIVFYTKKNRSLNKIPPIINLIEGNKVYEFKDFYHYINNTEKYWSLNVDMLNLINY